MKASAMKTSAMKASATKQHGATLVVGLGSSHGDDQAGWIVIERLEHLQFPGVELRQATVPHDLIDWLEGVTALHLIDGCSSNHCASEGINLTHQRFEAIEEANDLKSGLRFADSRLGPFTTATLEIPLQLRSGGSHQIDVFSVLELAACLNRLPKQVVLWVIPGERFDAGEAMTTNCEIAIGSCVGQLIEELRDA